MANDREVKYRITGDVSELTAALNSAESDFEDLGKAGKSINVLENAVASVRSFETEVAVAEQKVARLKATLSEAYASGAEAPQLKGLERDLAKAEVAASRTQQSLSRATTEVVRLNLEAGKTGVSTANLASRKAQLAVESEKVKAKMDALGESLKKVAAEEERASAQASKLNGAFSTLNIRSAEKINADIQRINEALGVLGRSATVSGAEFDRAYAAAQGQIAKLKTELAGMNETAESSTGIMGRLRGAFGGLQGILAALGIGAVGEKFLQANLAAEKLERGLTAITGSSKQAAAETKFLRDTASRLGLDFDAAATGFTKFAAATKGTTLEGQKTRDVFESVAGAMSKLGLSAVDQERAFNALGQMMSKGTVSAEELKGQLGDVLPGAFQIAARAVGVTTAELGKMMEEGGVIADTFLPRFAAELKNAFGDTSRVEGLAASFNRVKNQWSEFSAEIGKAGAVDVLKAALGTLNAVLMVTFSTIGVVVTGFLGFGKAIGVVAAAIATLDFNVLRQGLADVGAEMDKSLQTFAKLSNQALGLDDATKKLGESQKAAADAAAAAGPTFEKLQSIYGTMSKSAQDASATAVKSAEAKKAEGDASVAAANIFGTEIEQRNALAASTQANAAATENVSRARQFEAGVAQAYLAQVQQEVAATGTETEAQTKLIAELRQKAAEKQAVAEKSIAEAAASKLAADAAYLATQTYKDNSGALDQLRASAESASAAVEALRVQKANGLEVSAQLAEAERQERIAKALYRDAVNDQIVKINALNAAKQGEINVAAAGIKLQIEQQRAIAASARARGDEYTATNALLEIKKLEIKLAELTAKAKAAEAEAALLVVKAKREELIASGQLTPAKEAELKAQEAAAEVKRIEGKIASETAKSMKELFDMTSLGAQAASSAASNYDQLANSLGNVANAASEAGGAMSSANSAASSSSGAGGMRTAVAGDSTAYLYKKGASIEEARIAMKYFGELLQRETQSIRPLSAEQYARAVSGANNKAAEEAIALARRELASGQETDLGESVSSLTAMRLAKSSPGSFADVRNTIAGAAAEAKAQPYKIDINLGGKQKSVNVASQSDAQALTEIFRIIESDSTRAF